ncbi:MAG: serine/threonine-protein kinase [Sandaracinaceae bacterium]
MGAETDPLVGQVLDGRYRVERLVGGGGMGRVYEAVQVDLGRRVALKVLIPELARQEMILERFRREAQAAGVLANPHIVDVTDFVQPENEAPFLVMEHLVGRTLTRVLDRQGALGIGRARRICVQLLDGLQEAHDAGIIHRDLKPDNVFLQSLADGQEMVKLLDFGVAKLTEASPDGPALTAVGAMVGTPRFAAPEQLRGHAVDARTDVYGAGVLLYGMLTGRPPFLGSTQDVIKAVLEKEPPDVRIANPSIEPHLAQVVSRAIAKEPADRFSSAEEMLRELGGRRAKARHAALKVAEVRRAAEDKPAEEKKAPPRRGVPAWGLAIVAVAGLLFAGVAGVVGYQLGAPSEDADRVSSQGISVPSSATGACESFQEAACACGVAECESARSRLEALGSASGDPAHGLALEGWCRIALESGEACANTTPGALTPVTPQPIAPVVPPQDPPPPTPLPVDVSQITEALDAGSWRRTDGSFADLFRLRMRRGVAVEISMQGNGLEPHMLLRGPGGRIVAAAEGGLGERVKIGHTPGIAGNYVLEVGAGPGQHGDYRLTFEHPEPRGQRRLRPRVVPASEYPSMPPPYRGDPQPTAHPGPAPSTF